MTSTAVPTTTTPRVRRDATDAAGPATLPPTPAPTPAPRPSPDLAPAPPRPEGATFPAGGTTARAPARADAPPTTAGAGFDPASRSPATPARVQRQLIEVSIVGHRDTFPHPGGGLHRIGDVNGLNVLMQIEDTAAGATVFRWFNLHHGLPVEGTRAEWDFIALSNRFTPLRRRLLAIGRHFSASQWRAMWPDPLPAISAEYEAGRLSLDHDTVVELHRGQISQAAHAQLDRNEEELDALLDDRGRVARLEEYARDLHEAGQVRDVLAARSGALGRRLAVSQQQFHIGLPKRQLMAGPQGYQRLPLIHEKDAVDDALRLWLDAFPLLTRLPTSRISAGEVERQLVAIRDDIRAVRADLLAPASRSRLDVWDLGNVRSKVAPEPGSRTAAVVAAEDRSRRRWSWLKAGLLLAAGIALLFVPGGVFIDMAVGAAIAARSVSEARALGRAANTDPHADKGLATQAQAAGARFSAAIDVILAVGGPLASLRIVKRAVSFGRVHRALPELTLRRQAGLARAVTGDPELLRAAVAAARGDVAVLRSLEQAIDTMSRAELRVFLTQIATQRHNVDLVAALRAAHPTVATRELARLAAPGLRAPRVPHGMTAAEFAEAQQMIRRFLREQGHTGVEGFATGSRVTGATFNPDKASFGQLITDFARRDLDITLVTSRAATREGRRALVREQRALQEAYRARFGHDLGIRNIDRRQLPHIPVWGRIELALGGP